MTTEADLLQAIREDPDDNDVRLVYADWLEDHDRLPRAEFIRLQIAIDGRDRDDPEVIPLVQRQQELHRQHSAAWLAELPLLPEGLRWGAFHRGFVDGVSANQGEELLAAQDLILGTIPLRRLDLRLDSPGVSLAGSPLLACICHLSLGPGQPSGREEETEGLAFAQVLAWPELRHLTHLRFWGLSLTGAVCTNLAQTDLPSLTSFNDERFYNSNSDLRPLAEAGWLGQLVHLELKNHFLERELFRDLCVRLNPARLHRLSLTNSRLTDDAVLALAEAGLLTNLEHLNLSSNGITSAGVQHLVRDLPAHARLLLDDNPIGYNGLRLLADSPLLLRLSAFPRSRAIDAEGVLALASSPHARNVREIYLPHRSLSPSAGGLFTSPRLQSVTWMNLSHNSFGKIPPCHYPDLATLFLGDNQLDDAGLVDFCGLSRLPALRELVLDDNQLTAVALEALASSPGFPRLERLVLSGNPLGDAGAIALMEGPGLPALAELEVENCGITGDSLRAWMDTPRLARMRRIRLHSEGNPIPQDLYAAFCERAWQQGCDVDNWSTRPRLRPIRRPADGSPLPVEERLALLEWLHHLWFAEYHTVGWLKVLALTDLADRGRAQPVLLRYQATPEDDAVGRQVIGCFLSDHVMGNVPESVGVWNLNPAELVRIDRDEALAVVASILATSAEDPEGVPTGLLPTEVVGLDAAAPEFVVTGHEEKVEIPYPLLGTWFADDLFDPERTAYYRSSETERPLVIALDRDAVGIVWLE